LKKGFNYKPWQGFSLDTIQRWTMIKKIFVSLVILSFLMGGCAAPQSAGISAKIQSSSQTINPVVLQSNPIQNSTQPTSLPLAATTDKSQPADLG
jgi:uncharacterized lipoprotein YajG